MQTGELLLLNVVLLQIGQNPVAKATPAQVAPLEIPSSVVARLVVFQDQWPMPWEDFVQGPVKSIMQSFPGYNCNAWHGLEQSGEPEAILEVFGGSM